MSRCLALVSASFLIAVSFPVVGNAATIATGASHTCAIVTNQVWCWGSNEYGQLQAQGTEKCAVKRSVPGLPVTSTVNVDCRKAPVRAATIPADAKITAITAGAAHTCAIVNGAAMCWGRNNKGQLGDGQASHQGGYKAVTVKGFEKDVTGIAANGDATCAVANNKVACWGDYSLARALRKEESCEPIPEQPAAYRGCRKTPLDVTGLPADRKVVALAAGFRRYCAILDNASLWCWGEANSVPSQPGAMPEFRFDSAAVQMPGAASGVTAVAPSAFITLAVINKRVVFWGTDAGPATNSYTEPGKAVAGLPADVDARMVTVSFTPPSQVSCTNLQDGSVMCWGTDSRGGLSTGTDTPVSSPFQPPPFMRPTKVAHLGASGGVLEIASGHRHSCASEDGSIFCWGNNDVSQLGNGFDVNSNVPVEVSGLPEPVESNEGGK